MAQLYICKRLNLASKATGGIVQPTLVLGRVWGLLPALPLLSKKWQRADDELMPTWEDMSALPGENGEWGCCETWSNHPALASFVLPLVIP